MLRHDLTSLRLFVSICETQSLSRAAERMNMALSAASRRLHMLEDEVGGQLVKRMSHGLEMTTAGVSVLRYAQVVLRLADQLASNMEDYRSGARGRVRVFASSSALVQRLAADLAAFMREHPDIRIDLEERPSTDTLEALRRNLADLGVVVRGASAAGMVSHPYATDRLAVAVNTSHRLASQVSVTLADILDEDFVALDVATAVHRLIDEKVRELGRIMKLRVQVRSFEVMCHMVEQGLGIGILPETALRPLAKALDIRMVVLDEPWAVRNLDLVFSAEGEPSTACLRLIEMLRRPLPAVS